MICRYDFHRFVSPWIFAVEFQQKPGRGIAEKDSGESKESSPSGLADSAEGGVHWDWKYNSISYIPNQQIGAWGSPQCISLKTTIWDKIRPDPWLDPGEADKIASDFVLFLEEESV